ncbi:transposase (plasmid) [Escherichia coli]|uniref:Transposase n=2 Tax=Escherichia coli TaxID=562 RepID=A0A4V5JBM8_ECOLX|nr:hypothetical protein I3W_00740 [Escherichia coli O43 str. RM10042]EFI4071960.1 transposase [Escherichia coli]TDE75696.1 transposase [Escherichia sp. KCJ4928]EFJ3992961.1 transposase [Escherichia coli]KAB0121505.1 transposase [Escherichia coli]
MQNAPTRSGLQMSLNLKLMARSCIYRQSWIFIMEIISYNLATRSQPSMVPTMFTDELKQLSKDENPILHSDQGWQYQMSRWQRWLKDSGIVQSMSCRGNCLDNAVIESFLGTLKSECYYLNEYKNVEGLKRDIIDYINNYN